MIQKRIDVYNAETAPVAGPLSGPREVHQGSAGRGQRGGDIRPPQVRRHRRALGLRALTRPWPARISSITSSCGAVLARGGAGSTHMHRDRVTAKGGPDGGDGGRGGRRHPSTGTCPGVDAAALEIPQAHFKAGHGGVGRSQPQARRRRARTSMWTCRLARSCGTAESQEIVRGNHRGWPGVEHGEPRWPEEDGWATTTSSRPPTKRRAMRSRARTARNCGACSS